VAPPPSIPQLLDGKQAPEEPVYTPRELSKEISRLERLVKEVETQVTHDEATLKDLEEKLANLSPTADVFSLTREHQATQEQLEGSLAAWEEHSNRLERLVALRG
jgi:predicted  nucleic acid-binding Zn-ribbon protein